MLQNAINATQAGPGCLEIGPGTNPGRPRIEDAELVYEGPPVTNAAVGAGAQPATPSQSPVIMDTTVRGALAGVITTNANVGPPILIRVTGPWPPR